MSNGLQTFLRMAGLYNPQQQDYSGMPNELPVSRPGVSPPLINRQSTGIHIPGAFGEDYDSYTGRPVRGTIGDDQSEVMEAFRQSVLNPPKRTHMTYPENTLAGLDAALRIAAEPKPSDKNRIYIGGQAYQKQQVYTDPATGEKKFVTTVKDPSFMDQVLKAMPAAISPAIDILNQPHIDAVTDWELKNKGLAAAANAESQMALAGQRRAQTEAIPQRLAQGERALDIRLMDAQTRQKLAALKDLPDSEKMRLLQEGKVSLEELRASNQYTLQELRGAQRTSQIAQQGTIRSGQIAQQGAIRSGQIEQQGGIARDLARIRGEEARKTKTTPGAQGAGAANYPTQQRVALQAKTQQIINQNPQWSDYISINEEGFPEIEAPSWYGGPTKEEYDKMYEAIYGTGRATPINQPAAAPTTTAPAPPAQKPTTPQSTKPAPKPAPKTGGAVEMITPDGKSTRMVPANMVETAKKQGYKPKGKG